MYMYTSCDIIVINIVSDLSQETICDEISSTLYKHMVKLEDHIMSPPYSIGEYTDICIG